MSFIRSLFRKKSVIVIDDSVFGRITYERGIWTFTPNTPTDGFMITVNAPESGPSQLQRDFFQTIQASLSDFEQRARHSIHLHADSSVEASSLSVYSIEIGNEDETRKKRFVLELSDGEAIVIHRVYFSGNEVVDYTFDD